MYKPSTLRKFSYIKLKEIKAALEEYITLFISNKESEEEEKVKKINKSIKKINKILLNNYHLLSYRKEVD